MRFQARLLAVLICLFGFSSALRAQTPAAAVKDAANTTLFQVNTDAGLLGLGTLNTGTIPEEGPGIRLMWYPRKAAFRAGRIMGDTLRYDDGVPTNTVTTEWDDNATNPNVGYYSVAMGLDTRASGRYSFAVGFGSYATNAGAMALGEGNTASGAASVALGFHAHTNARQGSFVFADRSSTDVLRAGVNHSANWRVSGGFRIFTSSNLSTGVTVQSGASVSNWGQANAVISTSTGALLTTGGVWQNASDSTRKHHFEAVSGEDVLARLRTLPIRRWSYRAEPDTVRHLGPTSQDFRAAFGLGSDEKSIGTVDADGVALAGVQALDVRTREQEARVQAQFEALRAENAALRARLDALEGRGQPLAARLPVLTLALLAAGGLATVVRRRAPRATA